MYNSKRLVWQLDDNANLEPRKVLCGLVRQQARFLIRVNRLVVALAKSQDHRVSCGVFAFGRSNAVRQWLDLGYPVTRASQSREGGRILRAWWLKESEVVRCDDMAPKVNIEHRAKPVLLR